MKCAIVLFACPAALLAASVLASAAGPVSGAETTPDKVIHDADSAFTYLLGLAGDWNRGGGDEHEHGTPSRKVNFRVSAGGSAVVETFYAGQPNEMITVFHRNGDELLMVHYCALQNAPVMKFEKSDKPGEIKFSFHGGTNFDPATDPHVHEGKFVVRDSNTFESAFSSFTNGKASRPARPSLMMRKPAE